MLEKYAIERFAPGALVCARERERVVVAHEVPGVLRLRPLDGGKDDTRRSAVSDARSGETLLSIRLRPISGL